MSSARFTAREKTATTSSWEFEQKRDVARVIADAQAATAAFEGRPVDVLGECEWTLHGDTTDLGYRTVREPVDEEVDFDELDSLDAFYGPNGGYWR